MPIQHTCDGCGFTAWLGDAFAGRPVRCKHCGHRGQVPTFVVDFGAGSPAPVSLASRRARRVGPATVAGFTLIPLALAGLALLLPKLAHLGDDGGADREVIGWAWTLMHRAAQLVPLVAPAVVARRGVGTPGRWAILAAFCFVGMGLCAMMAFGSSFGAAIAAAKLPPGQAPGAAMLAEPVLYAWLTIFFTFGIPGSLLAAAVVKTSPAVP